MTPAACKRYRELAASLLYLRGELALCRDLASARAVKDMMASVAGDMARMVRL